VLAHGGRFLGTAGLAIAIDTVLVVLFLVYLVSLRRQGVPAR